MKTTLCPAGWLSSDTVHALSSCLLTRSRKLVPNNPRTFLSVCCELKGCPKDTPQQALLQACRRSTFTGVPWWPRGMSKGSEKRVWGAPGCRSRTERRNVGPVNGAAHMVLVVLGHLILLTKYTMCAVGTRLLRGAEQGEDSSSPNSSERCGIFQLDPWKNWQKYLRSGRWIVEYKSWFYGSCTNTNFFS